MIGLVITLFALFMLFIIGRCIYVAIQVLSKTYEKNRLIKPKTIPPKNPFEVWE